jgi:hypothetical protein
MTMSSGLSGAATGAAMGAMVVLGVLPLVQVWGLLLAS